MTYRLYQGDCLDVLPTLDAGSGRGHYRPAVWNR